MMVLAALIVSIIALLMALVVIAQRAWSKPNLTIGFDSRDVSNGKVMRCQLYNYPIGEGFKSKLGARTIAIEDLMADFDISEYGTNKVIYTTKVPYIEKFDGVKGAQRISLAPTIFPAHFNVASVNYGLKKVALFGEEHKDLPIGKYIVRVSVQFQENSKEAEGTLVVHGEHPYAYWS